MKSEFIEFDNKNVHCFVKPEAFAIWERIAEYFDDKIKEIWERIAEYLDDKIKEIGFENCFFPIFRQHSELEFEKAYIETKVRLIFLLAQHQRQLTFIGIGLGILVIFMNILSICSLGHIQVQKSL